VEAARRSSGAFGVTDTRRILVVDDDHDVREVLTDDLLNAGYAVSQAHSGNAALRVLDRERIDLVLSDVYMSDGDGWELLKEVRRRHPTEPRVVLITGLGEVPADRVEELGGQAQLGKPYDVRELLRVIRELLARG
jgi:two-component system OmpR family response regulator